MEVQALAAACRYVGSRLLPTKAIFAHTSYPRLQITQGALGFWAHMGYDIEHAGFLDGLMVGVYSWITSPLLTAAWHSHFPALNLVLYFAVPFGALWEAHYRWGVLQPLRSSAGHDFSWKNRLRKFFSRHLSPDDQRLLYTQEPIKHNPALAAKATATMCFGFVVLPIMLIAAAQSPVIGLLGHMVGLLTAGYSGWSINQFIRLTPPLAPLRVADSQAVQRELLTWAEGEDNLEAANELRKLAEAIPSLARKTPSAQIVLAKLAALRLIPIPLTDLHLDTQEWGFLSVAAQQALLRRVIRQNYDRSMERRAVAVNVEEKSGMISLAERKPLKISLLLNERVSNPEAPFHSIVQMQQTQSRTVGRDQNSYFQIWKDSFLFQQDYIPVPGNPKDFIPTTVNLLRAFRPAGQPAAIPAAIIDECPLCLENIAKDHPEELWIRRGPFATPFNRYPGDPPSPVQGPVNQRHRLVTLWAEGHRPQRDLREHDVLAELRRQYLRANFSAGISVARLRLDRDPILLLLDKGKFRLGANGASYGDPDNHGGMTLDHLHVQDVRREFRSEKMEPDWEEGFLSRYAGVKYGLLTLMKGDDPSGSEDVVNLALEASGANLTNLDRALSDTLGIICGAEDSFNFLWFLRPPATLREWIGDWMVRLQLGFALLHWPFHFFLPRMRVLVIGRTHAAPPGGPLIGFSQTVGGENPIEGAPDRYYERFPERITVTAQQFMEEGRWNDLRELMKRAQESGEIARLSDEEIYRRFLSDVQAVTYRRGQMERVRQQLSSPLTGSLYGPESVGIQALNNLRKRLGPYATFQNTINLSLDQTRLFDLKKIPGGEALRCAWTLLKLAKIDFPFDSLEFAYGNEVVGKDEQTGQIGTPDLRDLIEVKRTPDSTRLTALIHEEAVRQNYYFKINPFWFWMLFLLHESADFGSNVPHKVLKEAGLDGYPGLRRPPGPDEGPNGRIEDLILRFDAATNNAFHHVKENLFNDRLMRAMLVFHFYAFRYIGEQHAKGRTHLTLATLNRYDLGVISDFVWRNRFFVGHTFIPPTLEGDSDPLDPGPDEALLHTMDANNSEMAVQRYGDEAVRMNLEGRKVREYFVAGSRTRMFPHIRKLIEKHILSVHEGSILWFVPIGRLIYRLHKRYRKFKLDDIHWGAREMLRLNQAVRRLARENPSYGITEEQALSNQHLILHVAGEPGKRVMDDFVAHDFYGFNPDHIYFSMDEAQPLLTYDRKTKSYVPASSDVAEAMVMGHGTAAERIVSENESRLVPRSARPDHAFEDSIILRESIVDAIQNSLRAQYGKDVRILIQQRRINDLKAMDLDDIINIPRDSYALGLIDQGHPFVSEVVEAPPAPARGEPAYMKKTGGHMFYLQHIRRWYLAFMDDVAVRMYGVRADIQRYREVLKYRHGSSHTSGLVLLNSMSNYIALEPYAKALRRGLPVWFSIVQKAGKILLLPQYATNDVSQDPALNASAFYRPGQILEDFKGRSFWQATRAVLRLEAMHVDPMFWALARFYGFAIPGNGLGPRIIQKKIQQELERLRTPR